MRPIATAAQRPKSQHRSPVIDPELLRVLAPPGRLPEGALHALAEFAEVRSYPAGATLFRAGEVPSGIFLLLDGRVRVVRDAGERRHVVHTEGPGGTLAEVPFFDGGTLPATAIAAEPVRCALLSRAALEAAVRAYPEVAFLLLARLARRARTLVERLDRLPTRSVRERLAAYLLARTGRRRSATMSLGMTQEQLAEELGIVREVVVRELRALRRNGLIRPAGAGRIELLDVSALRALCGPDGGLTRVEGPAPS